MKNRRWAYNRLDQSILKTNNLPTADAIASCYYYFDLVSFAYCVGTMGEFLPVSKKNV